ncbi:hypothetical protein [Bartonella bacilliformis]|uniref:hypothetical protein n=1 Tax=Bartonella bacilliformis TaxID=774 RepID=UPI0039E4D6E7
MNQKPLPEERLTPPSRASSNSRNKLSANKNVLLSRQIDRFIIVPSDQSIV